MAQLIKHAAGASTDIIYGNKARHERRSVCGGCCELCLIRNENTSRVVHKFCIREYPNRRWIQFFFYKHYWAQAQLQASIELPENILPCMLSHWRFYSYFSLKHSIGASWQCGMHCSKAAPQRKFSCKLHLVLKSIEKANTESISRSLESLNLVILKSHAIQKCLH